MKIATLQLIFACVVSVHAQEIKTLIWNHYQGPYTPETTTFNHYTLYMGEETGNYVATLQLGQDLSQQIFFNHPQTFIIVSANFQMLATDENGNSNYVPLELKSEEFMYALPSPTPEPTPEPTPTPIPTGTISVSQTTAPLGYQIKITTSGSVGMIETWREGATAPESSTPLSSTTTKLTTQKTGHYTFRYTNGSVLATSKQVTVYGNPTPTPTPASSKLHNDTSTKSKISGSKPRVSPHR